MPRTAVVVGAGIIGLSAARALDEDGYRVTVLEQHRIGTPRGSSPGRSRIYRRTYRRSAYVRLARLAIEEWQRLDPALLVRNGLYEFGRGTEEHARALDEAGEDYEWLEPAEARRRFPEARFPGPVLHDREAGAVLADDALRVLARGLDVREGERVEDVRALEADVVCVCAGAWLPRLVPLPLMPQLEQVCYFSGVPETRPSVIDHGDERHPGLFYGVAAPGVGYKIGQDGARPGAFDPETPEREVDEDVVANVVARAGEIFPGADPRPLFTEVCLYTMSPDGDFVLDEVDGLVVCGGDSGHAFKFGPLLGRFVADLVAGRPLPPEAARFRADRFVTA